MCGTNGLKKLYDSEVEKKSRFYDVFDALLCNFCEAEAIAELNADKVDIRGMGRMLLADDELSEDFRPEMVPFLRDGTAHLRYLLGEQKHKERIIKIYDKIVCGLTVRNIVQRLSVSQHTIQQCRMIAVNELASQYELTHLYIGNR